MVEKIVHTNDATIDIDVPRSEKTELRDFRAKWCSPWEIIAPLLVDSADEFVDRMTIANLNNDENPNALNRYGARGIPTLMLFKNGSVQADKLGATSGSQSTKFLESNR